MSKYYNPTGVRDLFVPESDKPFRLSRSKIDLFLECPKCFYLGNRIGVKRPPGFPFSLNSAVDTLLKREFDFHRAGKTKHPLMEEYGIDAIPFDHPDIDKWRAVDFGRGGIRYFHKETGFDVGGAIDDVWVTPKAELLIVDYKATAKSAEVTLDAEWQIGYKRQMEVYQWLFMKNGFSVSPTGYFVYANGNVDAKGFNKKLEFRVKVIPYDGETAWVEPTLIKAKECLMSNDVPSAGEECDFCAYRDAVEKKLK